MSDEQEMLDDELSEHEEAVEGQMTLFEHLTELRRRLIYALIAVAAGCGISWTWAEEIFQFILVPLDRAAPQKGMSTVHYQSLTEPFFTLLKTSLVAGVFLAIPVILWQIWKFIAPALYPDEKRLAAPFVLIATLFFFGGGAFCYYVVMPYGFNFLFIFGDQVAGAKATIMVSEHYALATRLLLAFGAVFELPVICMFLSAMGLITHRTLIKYWRVSVVGSFIFAAMLTPPEVITQVAMAVPLILLYGLSIIVAYFFTVRREARERAEGLVEDQSP